MRRQILLAYSSFRAAKLQVEEDERGLSLVRAESNRKAKVRRHAVDFDCLPSSQEGWERRLSCSERRRKIHFDVTSILVIDVEPAEGAWMPNDIAT